jgi:hypothetical protein
MSLTLKLDNPPPLDYPKIVCDEPLHKKLDKINLTRNMNRCFSALIIGIPGSGKTSLLQAFLKTKAYFNRVFHKIWLFMPNGSRKSVKDSVFEDLPEEQLFEAVTLENLQTVWDSASTIANKKKKEKTLIVFDDVQAYFGNEYPAIQSKLLEMIANRRHAKLSFFILCQNYGKLPKKCRQLQTDIIAFNPSAADFATIFEEHSKLPTRTIQEVMNMYTSRVRGEAEKKERGEEYEKVFLYLNNVNEKVFMNFDEFQFPASALSIELKSSKGRKRKAEEDDEESKKKPKEDPTLR